jgi:hypothetical protein
LVYLLPDFLVVCHSKTVNDDVRGIVSLL